MHEEIRVKTRKQLSYSEGYGDFVKIPEPPSAEMAGNKLARSFSEIGIRRVEIGIRGEVCGANSAVQNWPRELHRML
jgi:hypothetical protein